MVNKTFLVPLDLKQPSASRDFEVVENDNGNILIVTLTDDGSAVDLSGCRILAVFSRPDGAVVEQDTDGHGITVGGTAHNVATIDLYTSSFSPGNVSCELQVYSGDSLTNLVTSAQFSFECRRSISNEDTIESEEKWPILAKKITEAETATAAAQAAVAFLSKFWVGTQAEYDALGAHEAGNLYFVLQED